MAARFFFARRLDDRFWELLGKPKPEWVKRRLREWSIAHGNRIGIIGSH